MKSKLSKLLAVTMCLVISFVFTGCGVPFDYDMSQYVKVGKYMGMKYDASKLKVSDKEIEKAIKEDLSQTATEEWVEEGKVVDGDTVNIDYSGKMDGKVADGTTAENQELEIGSGSFIPGFESGLVGKSAGETVVLNLTFPKDYGKSNYAGKDIEFTVKINKIKKSKIPSLTAKWVKENTSFKSVKEYRAKVKDDLYQQKLQSVGGGLLTSLTKKCDIKKYPDKELSSLVDAAIEYYKSYAEQSNMEYEDFVTSQMGSDVESFEAALEEQAKTELAQEIVAYYIAKKNDLEAQPEDAEKYVDDMIKANNMTDETFKENTGMSKSKYIKKYQNDIMIAITVQNVQRFLVENGKE